MPNGLKVLKQTDDNGKVHFDLVPGGEYNLQVSHFGLSRTYSGNVAEASVSTESIDVLISSSTILLMLLLIILTSSFLYLQYPDVRKSTKKNYKNLVKSLTR